MLELVTGVIIAIVALGVVLEPLLRPAPPVAATADAEEDEDFIEVEESGSAKIQALLALREIEFDLATGKLSEADYAELKQKYAATALAAIKAEQAAEGEAPAAGAPLSDAEALIARAKAERSDACPTCGGALEAGSVFCSHCGRSLVEADASPRCWGCGAERALEAKFCGECGAQLTEAASGV